MKKNQKDKDNNNEESNEDIDLEEEFIIFSDIPLILDELMKAVNEDIDEYCDGLSPKVKKRINSYLKTIKNNIEDSVYVELIELETNLAVLLQHVDELESEDNFDPIYGRNWGDRSIDLDTLQKKLGKEITIIKLDGKD